MGEGRCIIIGEVIYDFMVDVPVDILEYVNLIDLGDGDTVGQFKFTEPNDIRQIEPAVPGGALLSTDYSGLLLWDLKERYVFSWRVRMASPKFLSGGTYGRAIAVANDGISLVEVDTIGGKVISRSTLDKVAIGEPVPYGDGYLVAAEGEVLVLGAGLEVTARFPVAGLSGSATLALAGDSLYVIGERAVSRISIGLP